MNQADLDILKTLVEILQGLVTILAIVIAGVWAVYTFVGARSPAPRLQIDCKKEKQINLDGNIGLVISIRLKNIGRTRVKKIRPGCQVYISKMLNFQIKDSIQRIDRPNKEISETHATLYEIFEEHIYIEPDEEYCEEILLAIENSAVFKILVKFSAKSWFTGKEVYWTTSLIVASSEQA